MYVSSNLGSGLPSFKLCNSYVLIDSNVNPIFSSVNVLKPCFWVSWNQTLLFSYCGNSNAGPNLTAFANKNEKNKDEDEQPGQPSGVQNRFN
eukprot:Gb_17691 [translate_table: standard]